MAGRHIGDGEPVYIIAEAGVNHNGDKNLAKKLIDEAAKAGADAVKFQTFHADALVASTTEKADYQKSTTPSNESQYEMIKKLELSDEEFIEIAEYAEIKKILFLSTPFDDESVNLLERIGVPGYKISSGEITNFPLLKKVAHLRKPVILSTGMADKDEVADAFSFLKSNGADQIILLHCTTSYPAPFSSVNLRAMQTLQDIFHVPVGYSDHTEGIIIPVAAVAMGACVLEKHFTLDKKMEGPDHKASIDPSELRELISIVRKVETALGDGEKKPSDVEYEIKRIARKSIVAKRDINPGELITDADIAIKRPGTGLGPKFWDTILYRKAKCRIQKDQVLSLDMIE